MAHRKGLSNIHHHHQHTEDGGGGGGGDADSTEVLVRMKGVSSGGNSVVVASADSVMTKNPVIDRGNTNLAVGNHHHYEHDDDDDRGGGREGSNTSDDDDDDDDESQPMANTNGPAALMTQKRIKRGGNRHRRGGKGASYLSLSPESIFAVVWHRTSVLVSLLLLQSVSQFILEMYEKLISHHVIIPLFLTMLVGAGGNAGNQATVRAITGLVTGEFRPRDYWKVLRKEVLVGLINSTVLAAIAFGRVYYFYGHHDMMYSTIAISLSLFCIVFSSVILGTTLPFLFGFVGLDREHAAPVIQVIMDITGVFITCSLCLAIIPDSEGGHETSTSEQHSGAPPQAVPPSTLAPAV